MPQQINLCTPIFLTQKQQVSAQAILKSMAAFLVLGTILAVWWTWSLQQLDASYRQTISSNQQEIGRLQAAIKANKLANAPADSAMSQALQQQRDELHNRELLLTELRRGLSGQDRGHSARLLLLANTIPPQVWVTEVKADDLRFEISGFTLEPAALNVWMARLSQSPLLQDQQLATVKVERAVSTRQEVNSGLQPAGLMNVAKTVAPSVWSYSIVSAVATSSNLDNAGGKP
jgi:Tfp pilus assembly protein PilN